MNRDPEIPDAGRHPNPVTCPDPTVWYEIAAGMVSPDRHPQYLQHISGCGVCGALLRDAAEDLNDEELSQADAKYISSLDSAQPEWQRRLAQRIAGKLAPNEKAAPWWLRWRVRRLVFVAAGLAAAVILAQKAQLGLSQALIVQAYSDERTVSLRMNGASYSEFKAERGATASLLDRPVKLLLAEALIGFRLGSHSDDPRWLQAKAQADLLDGRYDAAEQTLNRALQISPKSVGILTDLATANSQRGRNAEAFEFLSQVLALKHDDPVALFNRALVSEHLLLYRQALEDWERYLKVDPGSKWAGEARVGLDRVRKQVNEHDSQSALPLWSPEQLTSAVADGNSELEHRTEEYLEQAVRAWLPSAFPEAHMSPDSRAKQALFFLSDLTAQRHNDHWLSDLLQNTNSPAFTKAIAALSHAAKANDDGEYEEARNEGIRAGALFEAAGNPAGVLRARFEQAFSAQLLRNINSCSEEATTALRDSNRHAYPWLQIQLELEKALCAGLMGDMGTEKKGINLALTKAENTTYRVLYLRALGFKADNLVDSGDSSGAWNTAISGLDRYWSEQFPAIRGYNLYSELSYIAVATSRPNLQVSTFREGVALIESNPDLSMRARAHAFMASAGLAARQPELAKQEFAEAARLYSLAPQTGAVRSYRIETEIQMAQLAASEREFDTAFRHLTGVQSEIQTLTNNYLQLKFYSILGEVQLRRAHAVEAEQALRSAMTLAEQKLASIHTETERINWSKDVRAVYLAMAEAELLQGRGQESLETFEWYLGAAQGVFRPAERTTGSAHVPDKLNLTSRLPLLSEETVLAYGILPDGLAVWTYDNRGVTARWIPGATQELQDLAERFHDLSSDRRSEMSAVRRDARGLYQALIGPIEDRLSPDRSLIVELDGVLAQVPFEALLDPAGHYLVERTPIVHSMGLESDALLRSDTAIQANLPTLIVGSVASSQADGLVPLPDVTAEADTVAAEFRSPHVLKGDAATLGALEGELPATAIFHFAGHSLFTPERAGLMLIGEKGGIDSPSLLDAEDLRRIKLGRLQLAVLSACSTASGNGGSRGFGSVTEALLRSGVPHVVASRWAVDSVATRPFLEDYYHNLLAGIPVSQVTRLTSRKILANPATSHPYYWSAFAAYGRP